MNFSAITAKIIKLLGIKDVMAWPSAPQGLRLASELPQALRVQRSAQARPRLPCTAAGVRLPAAGKPLLGAGGVPLSFFLYGFVSVPENIL